MKPPPIPSRILSAQMIAIFPFRWRDSAKDRLIIRDYPSECSTHYMVVGPTTKTVKVVKALTLCQSEAVEPKMLRSLFSRRAERLEKFIEITAPSKFIRDDARLLLSAYAGGEQKAIDSWQMDVFEAGSRVFWRGVKMRWLMLLGWSKKCAFDIASGDDKKDHQKRGCLHEEHFLKELDEFRVGMAALEIDGELLTTLIIPKDVAAAIAMMKKPEVVAELREWNGMSIPDDELPYRLVRHDALCRRLTQILEEES